MRGRPHSLQCAEPLPAGSGHRFLDNSSTCRVLQAWLSESSMDRAHFTDEAQEVTCPRTRLSLTLTQV